MRADVLEAPALASVNPFVRLVEAPIETLALLGGALVMLSIVIGAGYFFVKFALDVHTDYTQAGWTFPPVRWVLKLCALPVFLAVLLWFIAFTIYVLF